MDNLQNIQFPCIRSSKDNGFLRVFELDNIPFKVKRLFTVTANNLETRGSHAHKKCLQLITCISGSIELLCDNGLVREIFVLDENSGGILVSNGIWSEQKYLRNKSSILVFCSESYEEDDYIRDYDEYINWRKI